VSVVLKSVNIGTGGEGEGKERKPTDVAGLQLKLTLRFAVPVADGDARSDDYVLSGSELFEVVSSAKRRKGRGTRSALVVLRSLRTSSACVEVVLNVLLEDDNVVGGNIHEGGGDNRSSSSRGHEDLLVVTEDALSGARVENLLLQVDGVDDAEDAVFTVGGGGDETSIPDKEAFVVRSSDNGG
jgi:hypothetical protein